MKLYYSQNSPYARIARVIARELGIIGSVEELRSKNRKPDNPVLRYNPVGRVPTVVDGELVITEIGNVVRFLFSKSASNNGNSVNAEDWAEIMQEGQILGFLEGLVSWVRENRREKTFRSSHLLQVERDRAERCLVFLEREARAEHLGEFPVFRHVALAVGLGLMEHYALIDNWEDEFPTLARWYRNKHKRSSMIETAPN